MARSGRRLTMQPKEWGLGLAAGATLIIVIAVILAAVIFGLIYVAVLVISFLVSNSPIP